MGSAVFWNIAWTQKAVDYRIHSSTEIEDIFIRRFTVVLAISEIAIWMSYNRRIPAQYAVHCCYTRFVSFKSSTAYKTVYGIREPKHITTQNLNCQKEAPFTRVVAPPKNDDNIVYTICTSNTSTVKSPIDELYNVWQQHETGNWITEFWFMMYAPPLLVFLDKEIVRRTITKFAFTAVWCSVPSTMTCANRLNVEF